MGKMRTKFVYWLFRLSLLFMTLAPAFAEDSARVVHATPAMWVVHGTRGTAYLLGSIHALPDNIDWKTPQIMAAVRSANVFVFEIPMDSDYRRMVGRMLGEDMLLPLNTSLPSFFDSEMRSEWHSAVMHTGINADALVIMRPWYAARTLEGAMSGHIPIYAAEGVDNKIYDIAAARSAPVRGLETAEAGLQGLKRDATPTNEMAELRKAMRDAAARPVASFANLLQAWEKGDPNAIIAAQPDMANPAVRKPMIDDRNRAWLPKIEKMLNSRGTYFITVGAAHLVGPYGVPNLLRADGYKVEGPDAKS
jgi:uncharacterized protein YbaP (TraB family)